MTKEWILPWLKEDLVLTLIISFIKQICMIMNKQFNQQLCKTNSSVIIEETFIP